MLYVPLIGSIIISEQTPATEETLSSRRGFELERNIGPT